MPALVMPARDDAGVKRARFELVLSRVSNASIDRGTVGRLLGETIGNFRILSRLGQGGMGEVFLAEQTAIETKVAVKMLKPEISRDKEHVQRFFNEARAVSRIRHAGIVKIFDVGFHSAGQAYLIMEFLEGETLASRIARSGRLSVGQISDVGRQIASVLDATHAAGITHRDLKPENIFLIPDAELASRERVKILDFGIAKLTGTLGAGAPRTHGTMGTPAYMAPEQWGDSAKVDWRADVYSLGCVAFEMACGRPPFVAMTFAEACGKHLSEPPPKVRSLVADLPAALEVLLDQLLAKAPDRRPRSLFEIGRAFDVLGVGLPRPLDATLAPDTSDAPRTSESEMLRTEVTPEHLRRPFDTTVPPRPSDAVLPPAGVPESGDAAVAPSVEAAPAIVPREVAATTTLGASAGAVTRDASSRRPLTIAGVLFAAGAIAIVVLVSTGEDTTPGSHAIGAVAATPDAGVDASVAVDASAAAKPRFSLTAWTEQANPYVTLRGVRLQHHQVTVREYREYLATLPPDQVARATPKRDWTNSDSTDPVAWVTHDQARGYCATIGARLPSSDEWVTASGGAWGLASGRRDGALGPLSEWTGTLQGGMAIVRGGHAKMSAEQRARAVAAPLTKFTEASAGPDPSPTKIANASIGFRCAR